RAKRRNSRLRPQSTKSGAHGWPIRADARRSVGPVGVVQMAFIRIGADPRISDHPFTIADPAHRV
ncbi:hypothetical protein MK163_18355, partial [bacterium]|nr:hypothetical protein [bacterium]